MNIKDICWHEALELLIIHDSLTIEEFIMLLKPMRFSKEIIMDTMNKLIETPSVIYIDNKFMLDL